MFLNAQRPAKVRPIRQKWIAYLAAELHARPPKLGHLRDQADCLIEAAHGLHTEQRRAPQDLQHRQHVDSAPFRRCGLD